MDYLDFEIEIAPGSGRKYPIIVRSQSGDANETMRFPFDKLALGSWLDRLRLALPRSGGTRHSSGAPEEQGVQNFGRDLFDALFIGEVRSLYDIRYREAISQGKGVRLRLRIRSPEMAALPWEFMYDIRRGEYLSLSRNTPIVRSPVSFNPVQPLTVTLPLRILGMIASPNDMPYLNVEREKQRVEEAVSELQAEGLVELTWLAGQTWRDLLDATQDGPWHIFHFIGHGEFDQTTDEGLIILADEYGDRHRLPATQLARLLADHSTLHFVLLNACEGAKEGGDIFSSTASMLVHRGIPAVLAMQHAITDRAAVEFSRTFYKTLAKGMPVDTAVTESRKAISIEVANSVEWGTPVLYMRSSDGLLFDVRQEQSARTMEQTEQVQVAQEKREQSVPVKEDPSGKAGKATQREQVEARRKFEAAMPKKTKAGQQTEIRVMISLPNSRGLRVHLPSYTEANDEITKRDVVRSEVPIEFRLDSTTKKLLPVTMFILVTAEDFEIEQATKSIRIPPNLDSGIITFFLTPHKPNKRARVLVELFQNSACTIHIGSLTLMTSVEAAQVELVETPIWQLLSLAVILAPLHASTIPSYSAQNGKGISDTGRPPVGSDIAGRDTHQMLDSSIAIETDKSSNVQQSVEVRESSSIHVGGITLDKGAQITIGAGDVVGRDKIINIYGRSSLEALEDYLARAVAEYKSTMYQAVLQQPPSSKHPYKFLYSFDIEDASVFFGRDIATTAMVEKVESNRLTVLHARSGAGKTSLLNAGLAPRLIRARQLPVYIRTDDNPIEAIKRIVVPPHGPWPELMPKLSLQEFLGLACAHLNPEFQELVIVLDQFEEFFALLPEATLRQPFAKALRDCCEDKSLPVRFVIALRRENLVDLGEFQTFLPHILQNLYELPPMTRAEVAETIAQPLAQLRGGVSFEPELLEILLNDLGQKVELTHLQIVCTKLYNSVPEGEKAITLDLYRSLGEAEKILSTYLNDILEKLPAEQREMARNILKGLVSSIATNRVLSLSALQKEVPLDQTTLKGVLDQLLDARLVRQKDDVISGTQYEMAHAYLAEEIIHWIGQDELEVKKAQELLQRELASWRVHGTSISTERLDILHAHEANLYLDDEAQALVLKSALTAGHDVAFWAQQNKNKESTIQQVASYLIETRRPRLKVLGNLNSDLDRSWRRPLVSAIWSLFENLKNAKRENAAWLLLLFWLSPPGLTKEELPFEKRLRVAGALAPILARWGVLTLGLVLVISILPRAVHLASRERAIPGNWVTISSEKGFVIGFDPAMVTLAVTLCSECSREESGGLEDVMSMSPKLEGTPLPPFDIMDNEVTNAQYKQCLDARFCTEEPGGWIYQNSDQGRDAANKPVTRVTWAGAMTYCNWVGGRLPTELEWEITARGSDGNYFPWGNSWDDPFKANLRESGSKAVQSIASYADTDVSVSNVKNLAGNAQEWTASIFVPYSPEILENTPAPPPTDDYPYIIRGGSWLFPSPWGMGSMRWGASPFDRLGHVGFRCVCPESRTCKLPWGSWWIWFGNY